MATRTVDEGFRDFLTKLTPSSVETEAAKNHRGSIEACLEGNFGMTGFFRTGSFGNGTSISGYSDVDYFAVIPADKLKQNSSTSLRELRDALATRFPNTGVRVNCPAVRAPFGSSPGEAHEITPGYYKKTTDDGHKVYGIPDCADGWMLSSPGAHNAYVRDIDNGLSNKAKPLIRFIKAWRYHQDVPILSFYLELRTAKYASGETSIVYSIDVYQALNHLSDCGLAQMQDPKGISGYVSPCRTAAQLQDAKSKLATALSRAEEARKAEKEEKIEDAFYWWSLLFNGNFPGYYK
jgi:hypothetical protein